MEGLRSGIGARTRAALGMGIVLIVSLVLGPEAAGNTVAPVGTVDLVVEAMAQPNPIAPGETGEFEGVVRNRGTLVAEDVVVVFEVPGASVAVPSGAPECSVVGSTRLEYDGSSESRPWTITCRLGTLAPGSRVAIPLAVTAGTPGTKMSTARVYSAQVDGRPSNNSVESPLSVLPDAPGFSPAFQQPVRPNPTGRASA